MKVSLIMPIYNERKFIEGLCAAINRQTFPAEDMEAIFVDGGSNDGTLDILEKVDMRCAKVVLNNPKKKHVFALNQALAASRGRYVLRMDGHAEIEDDYIERCVYWLDSDPDVLCVGGPAKAEGYDFGSEVIAALQNSPLGLGGSKHRYAKTLQKVDTVFPGAWRREALLESGGWDEEMISCQDIELAARMHKTQQGHYMVDPAIHISYFPRNTLAKLAQQYCRYGYWRVLAIKKHPQCLRRAQLLPLALLTATGLGLLWLAVWAWFSWPVALVGLLPPFVYLLFALYASFKLTRGKSRPLRRFLMTLCGLFILHYCWPIGMYRGAVAWRARLPVWAAAKGHQKPL